MRTVRRSDRDTELLQFADDEFPERMILASEARGEGERPESPSPIAPTGYEDLMRAVGRWFDEQHARYVTIAESASTVILSADITPDDSPARSIEALLDETMITQLLDESFRLRSDTPDARDGGS